MGKLRQREIQLFALCHIVKAMGKQREALNTQVLAHSTLSYTASTRLRALDKDAGDRSALPILPMKCWNPTWVGRFFKLFEM